MNIVLLLCILLLLIYIGIAGLLVYYFFYMRDIWNIFIIDIYQFVKNLVIGCTRHNTFGIFIPGIIYSKVQNNNECLECIKEAKIQNSNLYNVSILSDIYYLLTKLDANLIVDSNISNKCKMFQHMLEYIIRNYGDLCTEEYTLYTKLQFIYLEYINNVSTNTNKIIYQCIEIIPILEQYISIFEKLNTICQSINIEQIYCTFIIAFYYNIKLFVNNTQKYFCDISLIT